MESDCGECVRLIRLWGWVGAAYLWCRGIKAHRISRTLRERAQHACIFPSALVETSCQLNNKLGVCLRWRVVGSTTYSEKYD